MINHTRDTSILAYHKIKENGLLSQRRRQVYETVFNYGPMTSAEAFKIINQNSPIKNITQSRARFTELRSMGVFKEIGQKICSVTGHTAINWDVTSQIPVEIKSNLKKEFNRTITITIKTENKYPKWIIESHIKHKAIHGIMVDAIADGDLIRNPEIQLDTSSDFTSSI